MKLTGQLDKFSIFSVVNILDIKRNNCNKWPYPDLSLDKKLITNSDFVSISRYLGIREIFIMNFVCLIQNKLKTAKAVTAISKEL